MGDLHKWRFAKGLAYAVLIWVGAALAVNSGAEPTPVYGFAATATVVFFVGEVQEIQIAGFVTAIFERRNGNGNGDG